MKTLTLWEGERLTYERSLALTLESLNRYGSQYRHWAIAYSGGKDSSAVVTLVASHLASGTIQAPDTLTMLYADTRMELPPLEMLRKFSNDDQQFVFYLLRIVEDIVFPKQIQGISFTVSYQSFTLIICKIALLNRLQHMGGVESGVSMPERSVTFDECLDLRYIEVEDSRLDTILPDISNTQAIKRTCKRFLQIIEGFSGASIDDLLYRSLRYPLSASRVSKLSLCRISELDFGCIRKAFIQPMIRRFSLNGYSRSFERFAQCVRCGVILISYVFHRFTTLVLLYDDVKWQLLAAPQIRALSRTIDTCITIMSMRAMLSSSQGLTALAAKEWGGLRCMRRTDWDIQVTKPGQNRSRTNAQFFADGSIPHVLNDIQIIQDIINGATTPLLDTLLCLFSDLILWRGTVLNHLPFLAILLNVRVLTSSFGTFLDKAQKAEMEEINARTGCIGCNLASKDVALDTLLKMPQWAYLAPLKRLKPLYQHLIKPQYRLRKDGTDRRKDGTLADNPMRLGPLTMAARREGLAQVLDIQQQVNDGAHVQGRPCIDLINEEEHARILALIEANTWPEKWTGEEARGDVLLDQVLADGVLQPLLVGGDG